MQSIDSQLEQAGRPLRFLTLLCALTISTTLWAQTPPLVITSPAVLSAEPGQSFSITVKVMSGVYPSGIALVGHMPIGAAGPVPVTHSSAVLSLTLPKSLPLGPYAITALGSDSRGELRQSDPITVDVERTDAPSQLVIHPFMTSGLAVGDTIPLTIIATFSDGEQVDVTRSTVLKATSENPRIVAVKNGIVTAVGSGQTNLELQYGLFAQKFAISVPANN